VDGEFAIFVLILILLDSAVGMVVTGVIKFQNASGETNGGIASPQEKEREIAARGQERESLHVVRFEKPFIFASMLGINPEAAVPCPGAITIHGLERKMFPSLYIRWRDRRHAKRRDAGHRRWWDRWFR
jgi:hypothetical protein